jgi:hypothetical protein
LAAEKLVPVPIVSRLCGIFCHSGTTLAFRRFRSLTKFRVLLDDKMWQRRQPFQMDRLRWACNIGCPLGRLWIRPQTSFSLVGFSNATVRHGRHPCSLRRLCDFYVTSRLLSQDSPMSFACQLHCLPSGGRRAAPDDSRVVFGSGRCR